MAKSSIDVVVGIDFGMTGTAVCYAQPSSNRVEHISSWIVGDTQYVANKVPTIIAYRGGQPYEWGFEARDLSLHQQDLSQTVTFDSDPKKEAHLLPQDKNIVEPHDLFKIWLGAKDDSARLGEEYTQYFLMELRSFLEGYFENKELLNKGSVQYLFSFPTTWDERTMARFHALIERAGYQLVPGQKSFLSLDEANAAMAFFHHKDKRKPDDGDIVVVADVGGATSDVCVGEINHNKGGALSNITIKNPGYGDHTGSTYIDHGFKTQLANHLREQCKKLWPAVKPAIIDHTIVQALKGFELNPKYKAFKHGFSGGMGEHKLEKTHKSATNFTIDLSVTDPGPNPPTTTTVYSHRFVIPRYDLFNPLFQEQCDQIISQLKRELDNEAKKKGLKHLILAGGLGSSPYILNRLQREYKEYSPYTKPSIEALNDSDLAVSRGLVHHELARSRNKGNWFCQAHNFFAIQQGEIKGEEDDKLFAIFNPEDTVKIGETKSIKMKADFGEDGKLANSLRLVSHTEEPPKKKLLRKGGPYKEWCRSLNIHKELTHPINAHWTSPSSTKRRGKPHSSKITIEVELLHNAIAFNMKDYTECFERFHIDWHHPADQTPPEPPKSKWESWLRIGSMALSAIGAAAGFIVKIVLDMD